MPRATAKFFVNMLRPSTSALRCLGCLFWLWLGAADPRLAPDSQNRLSVSPPRYQSAIPILREMGQESDVRALIRWEFRFAHAAAHKLALFEALA